MGVGDEQEKNVEEQRKWEKNAKRKGDYQVRKTKKCNKKLNTMRNLKNCFFDLKMWKILIRGQNRTKHKVRQA